MSQHRYEMVDLLEIFHARTIRTNLVKELKRLRDHDGCLPGSDPQRRREICDYYESMLIMSAELLHSLGD